MKALPQVLITDSNLYPSTVFGPTCDGNSNSNIIVLAIVILVSYLMVIAIMLLLLTIRS